MGVVTQMSLPNPIYDLLSRLRIKNRYNPVIAAMDWGYIYFGFSVDGEEGVVPKGMHSIKIPFLHRQIGFVRYKSFTPGPNYAGHKIRTDTEINRLETLIATEKNQIAEAVLEILYYIRDGSKKRK